MEAKLRMEQYTCEFLDHLLSNTIKLQWKTSRRLAIFWRVVDIIHTCLHDNKGISKRDGKFVHTNAKKESKPYSLLFRT